MYEQEMVPCSLQCSHACIPALGFTLHCHQHIGMQERYRAVVTWFPHCMQVTCVVFAHRLSMGFAWWPPCHRWHMLIGVRSPFFLREKQDHEWIRNNMYYHSIPETLVPWGLPAQGRVVVLFLQSTPAPRALGAHQNYGAAHKLVFCARIHFWSPSPPLSNSHGPTGAVEFIPWPRFFLGFLHNFQGQTFKTLGLAVLPLCEPLVKYN